MSTKTKKTTKRSGKMTAKGERGGRTERIHEMPTPTFQPNLRFMVVLIILATVVLLVNQLGYVRSVTDMRGLFSDQPSTNTSYFSSSPYVQEEKETLHVVFGLMGTTESLYDSWEMALKSVLANAPTDHDLEVHVICDAETGCPLIEQRMMGYSGHASPSASHEEKDLPLGGDIRLLLQDSNSSRWRNSIKVTLHIASQHQNMKWREFMANIFNHTEIHSRVSLGGYYRLLFHDLVLNSTSPPPSYDSRIRKLPWIYMDPDVLIMRNLNDLVRFLKEDQAKRTGGSSDTPETSTSHDNEILFYASKTFLCSGFIAVYPERLPTFWNLVYEIVRSDAATGPNRTIDVLNNNDQFVMNWVLQYVDSIHEKHDLWTF